MSKIMNRDEAIEALNAGEKITHVSFLPEEYIYMRNGQIMDENDNTLYKFWDYRTSGYFDRHWTIY